MMNRPTSRHPDEAVSANAIAGQIAVFQDLARDVSSDAVQRTGRLSTDSAEVPCGHARTPAGAMLAEPPRPAVGGCAFDDVGPCPRPDDLSHAQKLQSLAHFVPGIVHDFNNYLTGIVGCLRMMQGEVERENLSGVRRYVDAAHGVAERATSLTRRLLDFSHQSTEGVTPTDVSALIEGLQMLVRLALAPSVRIELQMDPHAGVALVDPSQLESAVLNLCINARDAMRGGGVVTIATLREDIDAVAAAQTGVPPGRFVCLRVSDTGAGIPPEIMASIFDPFFTTKPAGQGTGLGLSTLQLFARQARGHLRVDSRVGHGTTMRLYLPRHEPQASDTSTGDQT